eukprot:m.172709 g.172709  ORF g.172709 m.172709 type:complete len:512 (-) comp17301_c0_seq6:2191-3726(-)
MSVQFTLWRGGAPAGFGYVDELLTVRLQGTIKPGSWMCFVRNRETNAPRSLQDARNAGLSPVQLGSQNSLLISTPSVQDTHALVLHEREGRSTCQCSIQLQINPAPRPAAELAMSIDSPTTTFAPGSPIAVRCRHVTDSMWLAIFPNSFGSEHFDWNRPFSIWDMPHPKTDGYFVRLPAAPETTVTLTAPACADHRDYIICLFKALANSQCAKYQRVVVQSNGTGALTKEQVWDKTSWVARNRGKEAYYTGAEVEPPVVPQPQPQPQPNPQPNPQPTPNPTPNPQPNPQPGEKKPAPDNRPRGRGSSFNAPNGGRTSPTKRAASSSSSSTSALGLDSNPNTPNPDVDPLGSSSTGSVFLPNPGSDSNRANDLVTLLKEPPATSATSISTAAPPVGAAAPAVTSAPAAAAATPKTTAGGNAQGAPAPVEPQSAAASATPKAAVKKEPAEQQSQSQPVTAATTVATSTPSAALANQATDPSTQTSDDDQQQQKQKQPTMAAVRRCRRWRWTRP